MFFPETAASQKLNVWSLFFFFCLDHKTVVYYSAVKATEIEKMNMLTKLNPEKCQLCKYLNYYL